MSDQPLVLVVDDDQRIASAIRRALIYEGYQVEVARDGPVALTHVRERPPDLMILDVMLPGLDGMEVARRLQAGGGGFPTLMLTPKEGPPAPAPGLDRGPRDH